MLKDTKAFSGFSTNDVPAAAQFYGETLGLNTEEQNDLLFLHLPGDHNVLVYPKGDQHEPASFTVLNFQVPDVAGTVAKLRERGVEFERYEGTDIQVDDDGVFRGEGPEIAWFKDPAGNVLSVIDENA